MHHRQFLAALAVVGLPLAALAADAPAKDKAVGTVASVGDRRITASELEQQVGNGLLRLQAEEYAIKKRALDELVEQALFAAEAKRRGVSKDDLVKVEVEAKTQPVTEEEIRATFDAGKERMGAVSEAEALERIGKSMRSSRERQRRSAFVKELRASVGVRVFLEPPRVNVEPGEGPSLGPANAPVTIVEFSDLQCPYCARAGSMLRQAQEKRAGDVRLVFRHFPLPMHPEAAKAAEASQCAQDQGKFWELHDRLLANQKALQVTELKKHAAEVGLDAPTFASCLDSGKHQQLVQEDIAAGRAVGVSGTPTIFVNGRLWVGAPSPDEMANVIEEELQRKAAVVTKQPTPKK